MIITYEQAVSRTLNKRDDDLQGTRKCWRSCCGGAMFQTIAGVILMAAMTSYDPLVLGLAFLEVAPTNWECYYEANTPENPSSEP